MPAMVPLFLPSASFPKLGYENISRTAEDWVHDVVKLAFDQIPYVMQGGKYRTRVKLERKEPARGYGYGYIVVNDRATIPLFIANFELKRMKVFLLDGKFFPLNERRLDEELFNSKLVGQPKDTSDVDSSLYTHLYPPHHGKYVYARDEAAYLSQKLPKLAVSILDKLSGAVRSSDIKDISLKLMGSPGVLEGFRKSKTAGALKKLGSLKTRKVAESAGMIPNNITQIIRKGPDAFLVRLASDHFWDPKEMTVDRTRIFRTFGEKIAEKVIQDREVSFEQGVRPWTPKLWESDEDWSSKPKKLTKAGFYRVRTVLEGPVKGWFFPQVVSLDGSDLGINLLTDGKDKYILQEDIYGVESGEGNPDDPPVTEIRVGHRGCFLLGEGKATIPLVVQTDPIDLGTHLICEVADDFGMPYTIEITSGVQEIEKTRKPNTFLVSRELPWIEVGKYQVRGQDEETPVLDKSAADKASRSAVHIHFNVDGSFSLTGDLGAMSADSQNLERYRAKFYLMGLGMKPREADLALSKARENGQTMVVGGKVPSTQAEKYGKHLARAGRIEGMILALRPGLLKEASTIDDEATVDKVLSLNLITPENMKVFLEGIPSFKDAVSRLAQLWVLVQAGRRDIPETAVEQAMDGMEAVLESLQDIQNAESSGAPVPAELARA